MSINEKFMAGDVENAERVHPAEKPEAGEGETVALGVAISGFQEVMESKPARLALTGTKVLLFNAALFLPLIAMGFLIFS